MTLPSILKKIIAQKKQEIKNLPTLQHNQIQENKRNFKDAILNKKQKGKKAIIAECKKASPSAGLLSPNYNPAEIATKYEACNAAAVSVLTDSEFFKGSYNDLQNVVNSICLPVLHKDFIIDAKQIYYGRNHGASAFLLIAAVLDVEIMHEFIELGKSLCMHALVETHTEEEVQKAIDCKAEIIGINNRDLHTFKTDLNTTVNLSKRIREKTKIIEKDNENIISDLVIVSESAISTREHAEYLSAYADAFLIGTAFMKEDIHKKFSDLSL